MQMGLFHSPQYQLFVGSADALQVSDVFVMKTLGGLFVVLNQVDGLGWIARQVV